MGQARYNRQRQGHRPPATQQSKPQLPSVDVKSEVVDLAGGGVMEMMLKFASDPNTDVEKFERMVAMVERSQDRSAEVAYHDAMSACQADMEPVRKDAHNPQTKSRYATHAALDRILRPIYTRHGFGVSFDTADCPKEDHVRVVAKVSHRAGHKDVPHLDMPADGKGAKGGDVMTKTHAVGAAVTYGKRYLLGMVFNIAVDGDDDGNAASPRDMGSVFKRAVEEVNGFEAFDDLRVWKAQKFPGVEKMLSPNERNELVRLVNRRSEVLKAQAQER